MHFFLPCASFLPTLAHSTALPFLVLHSRIWEQSVKSYPRKHVISFPPFLCVSRGNTETKPKSLLYQGPTITVFNIFPIIFPIILLLQVFFFPTNLQITKFIHTLFSHPCFKLISVYSSYTLSKRKYPYGLPFVSLKKYLLLSVLLDTYFACCFSWCNLSLINLSLNRLPVQIHTSKYTRGGCAAKLCEDQGREKKL